MNKLYEGFMYAADEGGTYWVQTVEQFEQAMSNYYWLGIIVGTVGTLAMLGALIIVSNVVVEAKKKWHEYLNGRQNGFDSYVEKTR